VNEWLVHGGVGSAYFVEQASIPPESHDFLFHGEHEKKNTIYFPTVLKSDKYIVRTKVVVSEAFVSCYEMRNGEPILIWEMPTKCYTGAYIVADYVVAGDSVFRLQTGEVVVSLPKEIIDTRTRSLLYEKTLFVRTAGGNSYSLDLETEKLADCSLGPLLVWNDFVGVCVGIDVSLNELVATCLHSKKIIWRFDFGYCLAGSGWNPAERMMPVSVINTRVVFIAADRLILLNIEDGSLISEIRYFDLYVHDKLCDAYPGLVVGSHLYANQISAGGGSICLINYGHPGWIVCLDSNFDQVWSHITSEQNNAVTIGDILFTTSEHFHRGYDVATGREIWKSNNKSNCNNVFVGTNFICFEDSRGVAELYSWSEDIKGA